MKPFNIELVKQGYPVVTRDGCSVRIVCTDAKDTDHPIVALVLKHNGKYEDLCTFTVNGEFYGDDEESDYDLFMAPVKKSG